MANKLSHSSVTKHQHCGEAWRLHYIEGLRPVRTHAALLFGTAVGNGIEAIDLGKDGYTVFNAFWQNQYLNKVQTDLPFCIDIVYAESDFDKDLFMMEFNEADFTNFNMNDVIQAVQYKEEKGYENCPDEIKELANYGYWVTLKVKGRLMLDAYIRDIKPKIKKVYSTQEAVELENEHGDMVVMYLDKVVDFEGYDKPVILDDKTAAREYKEESAIYSPQLTLYVNGVGEKYGTRYAGFIVLSKIEIKNKVKICKTCQYNGSEGSHKTCPAEYQQTVETKKGLVTKDVRCNGEWDVTMNPKVNTQVIIDEIPIETENLVMENIENINSSIKNGIFTKNLSSCLSSFGKPCDFINLCYRGSMQGLVKIEKK